MTVKRIKDLATDNGVGFRQPANTDLFIGEDAAGTEFFYTDYQSVRDTVGKTGFADVRDYGATGDGITDDSQAIVDAVGDGITAPLNSNALIYFPKGSYYIGTTKQPILDTKGITFVGETGAELVFDNFTFTIASVEVIPARTGAIAVDAFRGDRTITMNADGALVNFGDSIDITNTEVGESQFGYTKAQTCLVVGVNGLDIDLSRPLNFDFSVAAPNNLVKPRRQGGQFAMHNMKLRNQLATGSNTCFKLVGLVSPIITDIILVSDFDVDAQNSTLFQISNCVNVQIERAICDQTYIGMLISSCLDTIIRNVRSQSCHHAVIPATFSENVLIRDFISTWDDGGIESHPAFNVTYENFQTRDRNVSNLRSIGGVLRNGTIRTPAGNAIIPLFQSTELTDPTAYDDYGFLMENVDAEFGGQPFILRRSKKFTRFINCNIDETVQFGLTPPTAFVVENITLRNLRAPEILYKSVVGAIDVGNSHLDAVLDSGRYEINTAKPPVGGEINIDENQVRVNGQLFSQLTTDPLVLPIRIYDIWYNQTPIPTDLRIKGVLKLYASMQHDDLGVFDTVEISFQFFHKPVPSPLIDMPIVPSFISDSVGSDNETLAVSIANPTEGNVGTVDAFLQFDLTLNSGGRTNPSFSCTYELEMWN